MNRPQRTSSVLFITHPEVVIDPGVTPARWTLSERGWRQADVLLEMGTLRDVGAVFCSVQPKAAGVARRIARELGLEARCDPDLAEVDRSATGYLSADAFDRAMARFFAYPQESVRGWERAVDAQRRIVRAVDRCLARAPAGVDVAIVSHGTVGALLLSAIKGAPIARDEMQPHPGHVLCFARETRQLIHDWKPVDRT